MTMACFGVSDPLVVQQNLLPVLRESEETYFKPHRQICSKLLSPWLAYLTSQFLYVPVASTHHIIAMKILY